MKYLKQVYFSIISTAIILTSCGDDESKTNSIRHIESVTDTCYVFVGSETGGVVLHLDSIKDRLEIVFPPTLFENFSNTSISFIDDSKLFIEQVGSKAEISNYMFENGSLYLLKNNTPVYYAEGDEKSLDIYQHYIAFKQDGDKTFTNKQVIPQKTVDKEDISGQSPFGSINNMKSKEDTLIWCTRISSFR